MMLNSSMTAEILSNDELAKRAPAIFAPHASPSRKATYGFVSTADVLQTLALDGWRPAVVGLKKSRTEAKRMYGSHTIRLRHVDATYSDALQGMIEIVLRNGHDGSSAVKLDLGVFRAVCANGLVAASAHFGGFRIFHGQYAAEKVRAGLAGVLANAPRLTESVECMRGITLDRAEQRLLAESASRLRWPDIASPVAPDDLLTPRRSEDASPDLWTTFNRVQENVMRGGLYGRAATGRRMTTRGVQAVDASHRLNRELWALAEGMAKLKSGAAIV